MPPRGPRRGEVDELAVTLAVDGRPPSSITTAEIRAAVELGTGRGLSAAELARRIGISERHVTRIRSSR